MSKPIFPRKRHLHTGLRIFAWVYFTFIFGWAIAHSLFGDHPWWLFVLNALAFYLFLPLPLIAWIAIYIRRWDIWLGVFLVFALAFSLYGQLFFPWRTSSAPAARSVTVMTYNLLRSNKHTDAVTNAVMASNADVIALQELSPQMASAIQQKLTSVYPYQQLDAQIYGGLGVISRYPLRLSEERIRGSWGGALQIISLSIDDQPVLLLNVHVESTSLEPAAIMEKKIAKRNQQVRTIMDFVAAHPEPLILAGDLNSTMRNTSYQAVRSVLADSWVEAGWGIGNTFPGVLSSRSSRLTIAGVEVPTWLVRIDYVFHSRHFRATAAHIGPWDGYSDHRPVIAQLVWGDHWQGH